MRAIVALLTVCVLASCVYQQPDYKCDRWKAIWCEFEYELREM